MITGIDETGDFSLTSNEVNFFVAVHIDQNHNKLEIKRSQFNLWESTIPNRYKNEKDKEIKGNNILDEYIESFATSVLEIEPRPLFSVVRIIPSCNPIDKINKLRNDEIKGIENIIHQAIENGNESWSKGYTKIIKWYKKRSDNEILKIKCLNRLLSMSFNRAFGFAQILYMSDNDVQNLRDICFKIDKDFIKPPHGKEIWNEIFRQAWNYNLTRVDPIPIIPMGSLKNPVYDLFGFENNKLIVSKVFKDKTEFLDSKNNWEIRMADLTGTILHRYINKNRCQNAGSKLMRHLSATQKNYEEIILE